MDGLVGPRRWTLAVSPGQGGGLAVCQGGGRAVPGLLGDGRAVPVRDLQYLLD